MTITIPTLELVGLLNDVVSFASADKEDPILRTVHLEWDGDTLHAIATDRLHAGWSRWQPSDPPPEELEDVQEDLFTEWGGDDDPWSATVDLEDVKEAARMFKLPVKKGGWTPLTLDCGLEQLTISRARLGAHTALKQECRRDVLPAGETYPDVRALLTESDGPDQPVDGLAFTACRLASFAKVRVRGPVEMSFAGLGRPVRVRIGDRFDGVILPVRADADNQQLAA